jgi:predicted naringenin-chalcone synthase
MSSVTVLFVLKRYFEQADRRPDSLSLISALGPGFCSETILMQG